jgi:hypothetical protein
MKKKFWLIILIILILIGVLFGYFRDRFSTGTSSLEKPEQKSEKPIEKTERGKGSETIKLEKPPFIKD